MLRVDGTKAMGWVGVKQGERAREREKETAGTDVPHSVEERGGGTAEAVRRERQQRERRHT